MLILITHLLPQLPGPESRQRPTCPTHKGVTELGLGLLHCLTGRLIYHSKDTEVSFLHNSRQSPLGA